VKPTGAERAILLTGIGGQGVQLAAQLVARAAVLDGREVMLFGSYGGMMRGGNTDATIVVGAGPISAPPRCPARGGRSSCTTTTGGSCVTACARALLLLNSTVFAGRSVRRRRPRRRARPPTSRWMSATS
jgi:hypothetical protein